MWKLFHLLLLKLLISTAYQSHVYPEITITKLINSLGAAYDYVQINFKKVNMDCLYGLKWSSAILQDVQNCSGQYRAAINDLLKTNEKIGEEIQILYENTSVWNNFVKYFMNPVHLQKQINFRQERYSNNSNIRINPMIITTILLQHVEKFEKLSDLCLKNLVDSSLENKKICKCSLAPACKEMFVDKIYVGYGYIRTHKLLHQQVAKQMLCEVNLEEYSYRTRRLCSLIYQEIITFEAYGFLDKFFDLFLEEVVLCAYEGFSDFFKLKWLVLALDMQQKSGCFPSSKRRLQKRNINEFADGCADHSTGLGAAFLSLYLNYILKIKYC